MAAGSSFGNLFRVTTWGESHGKGIGVVVDGCPAGLEISEEVIQKYLNRRKPGQTRYSTPRKEDDLVEIQSGVFEGKTTGTPISMVVYRIIRRLLSITDLDTLIILLMKNSVSEITGAAVVLQVVRL